MASLLRGFADTIEQSPQRRALELGDRRLTYGQLGRHVGRIATAIAERGLSQDRVVGVLARESLTAYAGVPATFVAGRGLVALDPTHPPARIADLVDDSRLDTLVVGPEALDRLEYLLDVVDRPLALIAPEVDDLRGIATRHPRHRYHPRGDLPDPCRPVVADLPPDAVAYLSYTSGTTGTPRGVPVTHRNLRSYLATVDRRFPLGPDDRCSHTFPLTFDLSIHDLLTTWNAGACLVAWPMSMRTEPARFIEQNRLTRWFSVPTVATGMKRLGALTERRFSSLETTLFCGEPLPASLAQSWHKAAPNSAVYNLYGPTEATIAVSAHRFDSTADHRWRRGVVPLGEVFDDHRVRIVDRDGEPVDSGDTGQLLVAGPQVTDGYWQARDATAERYDGAFDGDRTTWFRTGDLVECDDDGRLYFVGRLDEMVKLRGHHVALPEVDRILRRACGHEMAAAVGWPRDSTGVYGLVGLVATDDPVDPRPILARCRRHLPNPMVPDRIVGLSELPTNRRGKLDRRAMQRLLHNREVTT